MVGSFLGIDPIYTQPKGDEAVLLDHCKSFGCCLDSSSALALPRTVEPRLLSEHGLREFRDHDLQVKVFPTCPAEDLEPRVLQSFRVLFKNLKYCQGGGGGLS